MKTPVHAVVMIDGCGGIHVRGIYREFMDAVRLRQSLDDNTSRVRKEMGVRQQVWTIFDVHNGSTAAWPAELVERVDPYTPRDVPLQTMVADGTDLR